MLSAHISFLNVALKTVVVESAFENIQLDLEPCCSMVPYLAHSQKFKIELFPSDNHIKPQ